NGKVARIHRESPLPVPRCFLTKSLTPVDIAGQLEDIRIIRQRALGNGEFGPRLLVIEIATVKEISPGKMRLSRIRAQTNNSFERAIRQSQTGRCVIETKKIQVVVGGG